VRARERERVRRREGERNSIERPAIQRPRAQDRHRFSSLILISTLPSFLPSLLLSPLTSHLRSHHSRSRNRETNIRSILKSVYDVSNGVIRIYHITPLPATQWANSIPFPIQGFPKRGRGRRGSSAFQHLTFCRERRKPSSVPHVGVSPFSDDPGRRSIL